VKVLLVNESKRIRVVAVGVGIIDQMDGLLVLLVHTRIIAVLFTGVWVAGKGWQRAAIPDYRDSSGRREVLESLSRFDVAVFIVLELCGVCAIALARSGDEDVDLEW
jgi:hypothetical protein